MKTKTPKTPLVGPKGRIEILNKIKVLEKKIKELTTRQPVTDITALTAEQLDALEPGDVVVKKTDNMYHTYIVSYKGEGVGQGICLTYTDAGHIETVSYDRTESGWAYNSTDVCEIP